MPSVYIAKRKRKQKDGSYKISKVYWVEIRYGRNGPKFHRSTKKISKRQAEEAVLILVKDIEANELKYYGLELMTIDTMMGKWWIDKGRYLGGAETEEFRVNNLIGILGKDTPIKDLGDIQVNKYIQARKKKT